MQVLSWGFHLQSTSLSANEGDLVLFSPFLEKANAGNFLDKGWFGGGGGAKTKIYCKRKVLPPIENCTSLFNLIFIKSNLLFIGRNKVCTTTLCALKYNKTKNNAWQNSDALWFNNSKMISV